MLCEIIEHRVLAFRREQIGEIVLHEFVAVIAEQRFGAAVAGIDIALGVEHHDAFGRGVEDGAEFLGIGMSDRRWLGGRDGSGTGRRRRSRRRWPRPRCRAPEKISASADSSSQEIV